MDFFFLDALAASLKIRLDGSRIRGISQPSDRSLALFIKTPSHLDAVLLMETTGRCPGIYLLEHSTLNRGPETPLARSFKNKLLGARIVNVFVSGSDRDLVIEAELSEWSSSRFIHFEIRGATGNICCVESASRIILECLTKVPSHRSQSYPRFPGAIFIPQSSHPPPDIALDLELSDKDNWEILTSKKVENWQDLLRRVTPCTPALAKQFEQNVNRRDDSGFFQTMQRIRNGLINKLYTPCIVRGGHRISLHALDFCFDPEKTEFFSDPVDAANLWRESEAIPNELNRLRDRLTNSVNKQLKKTQHNLASLKQDLANLEDAEALRKKAELLTIHYHRFTHGIVTIDLPDTYQPGHYTTTTIDAKTPLNVQIDRLFKRASKIVRSRPFISHRIDQMAKEIDLLSHYRFSIISAENRDDLDEIREKLIQSGLILSDGTTHVRPAGRIDGAAFLCFKSEDSWTILAGRNARENDLLTFKRARPYDFWLHAKGFHGAHVLILNETRKKICPERTVEFAAKIAVYYSAARGEKAVSVMLAPKNQIRRMPGGVPGRVVVSRHQTIQVDSPDRPA